MENNDSYIENIDDIPTTLDPITPQPAKPERVVWGVGFGNDCYYKTIEEAFVGHLFILVANIGAKKNPEKDLREFCESWQSDPNLTDHERETLLSSAYDLARTKIKNTGFQTVAQDYSRICDIIEGMQENQSEQDGM